MKVAFFCAWLACSMPLGVHAQAQAQDSAYTQLITRALAEYDGGRWEESYALFERAHAVRPSARTLRGMGLASFEMRDYVGCLRALQAAIVHPERKLDAQQHEQAEQLIAQAEDFVARRELVLEPADAQLLVDGDPAELRDDSVLLNPGDHELTVSAPGYASQRMTISARSGSRGKLALTLERLAGPPQQEPLSAPPAERTREDAGGSVLPIVLMATGGALIAGAAVTGIVSLDAASELEELCGPDDRCPPSAEDAKSRGETTQTLTWILGPAGVVALGIGVVLAIAQSDEEAPAVAFGCGLRGCSAHARLVF